MTIHQTPSIQRGVEITVPLAQLKASPKNARKTPHASADIEALAASIAAKGLLQPPVVEPERRDDGSETGAYLVTIGEGRRQALRLLAKRKRLARNAPVRCLLDVDNDAFEISLDENVTRFAMHPADQFEAFRQLAETQGRSADEIAARFGVTAQTVRQRLRLGAVSPLLLPAYRAGDLALDQLMAFGLSEDHARQEQVFDSLAYNRSPSFIRRALTEREVPATDRRAVFVGAEAYQAAGGRIRRDLFADDQGGWFEDVGLLERLCLDQLQAEADRVRTAEGWRWAEVHLDYPHGHGLSRAYPRAPEPDAAMVERLSTLSETYDRLIADLDEGEPTPEVAAQLSAIDAELKAASEPVYDADQCARAGLFVLLSHDGRCRVERGLIRPEDAPDPDPISEPEVADAVAAPVATERPKPLPDRLVVDLTAHRTAALRVALGDDPETAMLAALHALVQSLFCDGWRTTCLRLSLESRDLSAGADAYADSPAARALEARHAHWAARLPQQPDAVWAALCALSPEDRLALFAHCIAASVDAVQVSADSAVRPGTEDLAQHLSLDMTAYWRATVDSYFGRVSKALILAAVQEARPEAVDRLRGMKKDAMAHAAAVLLGAEGWLPPLLRPAAATPA